MASKHIINCPCCFKIFKKAGCYEKHIFTCQRTNEEDKTPSVKQLYEMITILTEKYNTVQSELDSLKRQICTKNKKLDVLAWLNEQTKPNTNWNAVMENMEITVDDLQLIFKNGFIDGSFEILNNYLQRDENRNVVKCFEQKNNVIYVFDNEWKELQVDAFKTMFNVIYKEMLAMFDVYKTENETRLNDDQFQIEYSDNFMKLLCVNIPFENKCTRIKNKIYTELKESFKKITEMDI
jgi:hypothetical protein